MNKKLCYACKKEKLISEFYKDRKRTDGFYNQCKECFNIYTAKLRVKRKEKAIEYKGNKCERCLLEYPNTPYYIFDFHHKNPIEKEFVWNEVSQLSWETRKKELNKCILLCANCHRHVEHEKLEKRW